MKSSVVKNSPSPSNDQERILNSNDDTNYTKNSMDSSCSPLDESDCSGYLEYHSTFESIKRPKNRRASTEEEDIDYSEIQWIQVAVPLMKVTVLVIWNITPLLKVLSGRKIEGLQLKKMRTQITLRIQWIQVAVHLMKVTVLVIWNITQLLKVLSGRKIEGLQLKMFAKKEK